MPCAMCLCRSVRLAHVLHLLKSWPMVRHSVREMRHSMREREERALGQVVEADHLQRFCFLIAAASSDVVNLASTRHEDDKACKSAQEKRASVAKGWAQLSQLLWIHEPTQEPPALISRSQSEWFSGQKDAEGSKEEDDDIRGIWATPEEQGRGRQVLFSALRARASDEHQEAFAQVQAESYRQPSGPSGNPPRVQIHEPQDGADLMFDTFQDKTWTVRATIDGFEMGVDVGYACVFLDGIYKGCSVDAALLLLLDDPGLDFTWHLLEVRFWPLCFL